MAQKQSSSPQRAAMQRISELLGRGAGPDRMDREVDAIVSRLRAEGEAEQVQEWLETLRDGFAENAEAALEAVDEIESTEKAARRHAENAARAIAACRDAFSRHLRAPVAA
ncbi:hypothetical protein J8J14_18295 [Roseomonas sp. SSH11]|uniref:Uncharacterized protein n=1 Tax=Pararoseomonas baculiformis TaxID=2820812 RepID=A0ABS4AI86_9PROT|nr:hypothetical protein [Pararoseomonas baculiformis]MBP0446729.1 hypothetical protein [Pararoseomonas baculiformis]